MRLTILINGSDPTVNHDYAVLWLDTDQHRWSRESHDGIDLPEWGELRDTDGVTSLCAPLDTSPLCTLRGLYVNRRQEISSAHGDATWSCETTHSPMEGQWRLQAVDRQTIRAEHALFAG
ncbi:DUF3564 domain-containing protein [Paraburkholderia sp. B3]|uniref:DUF3564 domain-containing protein n=1 Tax=Paraburkholderia sp. B3 TaxID=3134791 RepID=UPI00398283C3